MPDYADVIKTVLLFPLLSAGLIAVLFRRSGMVATGISVFSAGLVMLNVMVYLLVDWNGEAADWTLSWLQLGDWHLELGLLLDRVSAPMLAIVAFIGFWIHIFSVGYMEDDASRGRFFGGLSFFMFSMYGIVLADNLFMMFIFWELVGFSSYMLIAHYWDKAEAAEASKKAFVVNRIGDLGFLVGIVWAYNYYGTTNFAELSALIASGERDAVTGIGLCLICGFLGKSAQFPLQVWLTDAMAGPTPVSALIHAATMVAAGIFLLVRLVGPMDPETFALEASLLTPFVLNTVLWLGALMVCLAGFWALGQTDIKKTLAYSTLSHLGFMATAVGLGMPALAMLHLAMHACFKATLFLCAGSVIHACHHEQDMFRMGGLRKKMPLTFAAFVVALLANCAIYPFAGYFSKEGIIGAAYALGSGENAHWQYMVVFGLTLAGAVATSLYMGRMLWVVFFGKPNSEAAEHAHESSLWMVVPLMVLGVFLSLTAGWFVKSGWPTHIVGFLKEGYSHATHLIHEVHMHTTLLVTGLLIAVVGLALTYLFYGRGAKEDTLQKKAPVAYRALERHGWFDDLYALLTRHVFDRLSVVVAFVVDFIVVTCLLVQGAGASAKLTGRALRTLQTGSVHAYVFWLVIGCLLAGAYAFGLL